jgi:hypothetical protein
MGASTKGYVPTSSEGRSPKSAKETDSGDSRRKGPQWAKRSEKS